MRRTHPDLKRPFKVPFHLPVSILGALACLWVMWGLPTDTWIRLFVWLIIGFFIYAFYGRKHSLVRKEQ
jgi:APA family basic amino acid/polyamine antiporter